MLELVFWLVVGFASFLTLLGAGLRVKDKWQGYKGAYALGQLQGEAGCKFTAAVRTARLRVGFMRYAFMRGWRRGNLQYSRKLAKFCSAYGGKILYQKRISALKCYNAPVPAGKLQQFDEILRASDGRYLSIPCWSGYERCWRVDYASNNELERRWLLATTAITEKRSDTVWRVLFRRVRHYTRKAGACLHSLK